MGLHGSKPFKTLTLLLILASTTFCSEENKSPASFEQGGQDTGGGIVFNSTREESHAALDLSLKLATEKDMGKNIFVQFWKDWGQGHKNEIVKSPSRLFSYSKTNAKSGGEVSQGEIFESPYLMALSKNKINKLESGDCLFSDGVRHTDASVSSLSIDAEICFSVGNLMRIPRSSLLREILSLVLHEVSHLGGAKEDEAVLWQKLFSEYFGARFGDLSPDMLSAKTFSKLSQARILLTNAKEIAVENPKDPRIYVQMGKFAQTLESLPEVDDALALELKLRPSRLEYIANYQNLVDGLIKTIRLKFEIGKDNMGSKGFSFPMTFMRQEEATYAIDAANKDFERINESFLRLTGASGVGTFLPCKPSQTWRNRNSGNPNEFPPATECQNDM